MLIEFFNGFVKVTGWPAQKLIFRTKIYYEDKQAQGRHIRGGAMVVSNHTSVFDYAAYLFVFFTRTLRVQMAEVLFQKQPLGLFLKCMGGLRVDRNAHDFGFVTRSQAILQKGGVVEIFPESRLPLKGEERPLPFQPGAAYLALLSGAPVIPVYTDGAYFSRRRAHVIIGKPLYARDLTDGSLSEKENLARVSAALRDKIISLEKQLNEQATKS
jgi:1-acyl-sn-glycerol-3-phosphate acyltransferase